MPDLVIERKQLSNGAVELVLNGYLDAHTFERMESVITDVFTDGSYRLIIDLAGVEYISSAGAGVFIGAHSESRDNGGKVVLLNPSENVKEILDLLGLTSIFTIAEDRQSALAALS